jgi:hypothetical protein
MTSGLKDHADLAALCERVAVVEAQYRLCGPSTTGSPLR